MIHYWHILTDAGARYVASHADGEDNYTLLQARSGDDADGPRGCDRMGPHRFENGPNVDLRRVGPGNSQFAEAELNPGEHYARVWRPPYSPLPARAYPDEWTHAVHAAKGLFERMVQVLRTVQPAPENGDAYGHDIRDLLILAATEVESGLKEVSVANGVQRDQHMGTRQYVQLAGPMRLREWRVRLAMFPDASELSPFGQWNADQPTQSLRWYDSYNAAKHSREADFPRATVAAMLDALAAVYVMVVAQFGELPGSDAYFVPTQKPQWSLAQLYVPPGIQADAAWTAVSLPL